MLTTSDYPLRKEWTERAEVIEPRSGLDLIRQLVARSPDYEAVVLWGEHRSEQTAALVLARLGAGFPWFSSRRSGNAEPTSATGSDRRRWCACWPAPPPTSAC